MSALANVQKKKKKEERKQKKEKRSLPIIFLFCFLGILYIPYSSLMGKTELPKIVIAARLSSSSRNGSKYCKNCYKQRHLLFECPIVQFWYCHKIGHIIYNCPTKPSKLGQSGILPRPGNHSVVAAAAKESLSTPSPSSVLVSELGPLLFFMVKQFLSTSGKVSFAVSSNTWYFDSACCNHVF